MVVTVSTDGGSRVVSYKTLTTAFLGVPVSFFWVVVQVRARSLDPDLGYFDLPVSSVLPLDFLYFSVN